MIAAQELPRRQNGTFFIYALTDPDTAEIRYIGRTVDPRLRYRKHCNWQSSNQGNPRLRTWIADLDAADKKPQMVILVTLTGPYATYMAAGVEQHMIRWRTDWDDNLLQTQCVPALTTPRGENCKAAAEQQEASP